MLLGWLPQFCGDPDCSQNIIVASFGLLQPGTLIVAGKTCLTNMAKLAPELNHLIIL